MTGTSPRVGLLHPGDMGAAVGAALARRAEVCWVEAGRSPGTRRRAEAAGLRPVASLEELVSSSGIVVSVCPPAAALEVARAVAGHGFSGIYVDANAISPASARDVGEAVVAGGARFVDGGIIGPPPAGPGTTRLYLAGEEASTVARLLAGSLVEPVEVAGAPGTASALKMAYAAWTKGSSALLLAVRALAEAEGVSEALRAEWALSQPGLEARSAQAATANAFKAWRFVGEMHEIADSFAEADLPEGFHRAAAEVYRRLEDYRDRDPRPGLEEILPALLEP